MKKRKDFHNRLESTQAKSISNPTQRLKKYRWWATLLSSFENYDEKYYTVCNFGQYTVPKAIRHKFKGKKSRATGT